MASGSITSNFQPYMAGDTLTFGADQGCFVGMSTSAKILFIMIPLSKPIADGVTAKLYGSFTGKVGTASQEITLGSANSPVTCTKTPNGIQYRYQVGSNTWTANCTAVFRASTLVVIKFE